MKVESIENHFAALGRVAFARRGVIDGTAVYCEWETDPKEWSVLEAYLRDP